MRARIAALALMALVAPSWAADQAVNDCMSNDSDRRIIGCTALMKMAARLKPSGLAVVYDNRGSAYYGKGQNDRAIADDNKALQLNPAYPSLTGTAASLTKPKVSTIVPSPTSTRRLHSNRTLRLPT